MLTALNSVESMIHGSAFFAVLWVITTIVVAARVFVAPARETEDRLSRSVRHSGGVWPAFRRWWSVRRSAGIDIDATWAPVRGPDETEAEYRARLVKHMETD